MDSHYIIRYEVMQVTEAVEGLTVTLRAVVASRMQFIRIAFKVLGQRAERIRTGIAPKHSRTRKKQRLTRLKRRQKRQRK